MSPAADDLPRFTDKYFLKTKDVVCRFGDVNVTYAVFMRRPVVFTPRLAVDWLREIAAARGTEFAIELCFEEGDWVGAGEPLMYISGSMVHLVDLETVFLQKLGPPCVAAFNAFLMCSDLPYVAFIAMDARHCAGAEMAEMMAYAASVGSAKAKREANAKGFIGNDLFVLIDYFGREVTDTLEVCRAFPDLAREGRLGVRVDTHGGRFVEGLDTAASYAVLERRQPDAVRTYRTDTELRWLVGTGVTAAAIFHMREKLDEAGFEKVKIIASSGFDPRKCKLMASVNAPIDIIGTGSYLPELWSETYATADIVAYDDEVRVKIGREFLFPERPKAAE